MKLYYVLVTIFRPLARLIFPVKVIGKENLSKDKNYILCCNHISLLDPVYLIATHKRAVHFMAKDSLFKNKFFGWLITQLGAFPVKRGTGDMDSVRTTFTLLEQNEIVGIFPEGHRSKDGEVGIGKAGAALIAHKSGIPLLPAGIYSKGGQSKPFKKVVLCYGKPFTVAEFGLESGNSRELKEVTKHLMAEITALRDEAKLIVNS